jgi:hypothetical protein
MKINLLSSFHLKTLAMLSMVIDHVGFAFELDIMYRNIGRISFPIFAYFIAEGCLKTSNKRNYLLRLAVLAVLSQLPYMLLMQNDRLNIFATLALGVLAVMIADYINGFDWTMPVLALSAFCVALAGDILNTDYGTMGVLVILAVYLTKKYAQSYIKHDYTVHLISLSCIVVFCYFMYIPFVTENFLLYSIVAPLLLMFYNGKRGFSNKWVDYGFYGVYPVHMVVLYVVR